jgi:DNA polymerase-3 subunit beta
MDLKADSKDSVYVGVTENQIVIQLQETTLLSRLIGGTFPNYDQIIPKKKDISIILDTKELLAVTKRAALCVLDRGGSVMFDIHKNVLYISASSQNLEFNDEVGVDYSGEEFKVAFNPYFLVDALKHVDSNKVSISFTTPVNPALIEPVGGGYKFIIMPMRI